VKTLDVKQIENEFLSQKNETTSPTAYKEKVQLTITNSPH